MLKTRSLRFVAILCVVLCTTILLSTSTVFASEPESTSTDESVKSDNELAEQAYNEFIKAPTARKLETSSMQRSTWDGSQTYYISWYRGSFLASLEHFVDWNVNLQDNTINWSSAYQQDGWIFPSIVRKTGISRVVSEPTHHGYLGTGTISVGTVTPWGDVTLVSYDVSDYVGVFGDGSFYPQTN